MQTCDVVIAATGDDKVNLAASLLAKTEFGVDRVVARVNDMRNEWLFTEASGTKAQPYNVMSFDKSGTTRVFAKH